MKLLTTKSRIAIGLVCLLVSVLCTAMMLGLVPERRSATLAGRATTCETIAMASSDYISRGELRRLEFLLDLVVRRNEDILSAGVRRSDGTLVITVGDHEKLWTARASERSSDSQLHVPIRTGQEKWGSVELRFQPLGKKGLAGWFESSWLLLTAFVSAASYLLFQIYLKQMLAHLDPSKTVPKRVRSALDSLAEGLLVIDNDGRIVLANQSLANWVGRAPEKLIGVSAGKLEWVKDEQGDPLKEYPWDEAIRLETPQAGVMLGLAHKDEPTQVLMANASPVLGHDGKHRGVLVSFDDVTQLEETKRHLRVAVQVADQANQAKSEFLARMSHEIRTPMNAILGYTDVLRRGFDESIDNRQEYLDTIHGSGEHLLALINDILDLSKVESGQMELEMERCSPHKIISQVVALLRSKADEKGISLQFRCDGLLPETILADSVRLRQTIMNLAGNAIKFTETGGVTIAARIVGRNAQQMLQIDVIDTGIGIPEAAQEKIFEPFAQADNSVTRKFGGTGLGLAISKQLAEAMGGGIEITSEEGNGSTFTVTLDVGPLDGIKMIDGQAARVAETQEVSETKDIIQLPPARILVADDGESNRKLIELVLGRAGVEVVSVENGQLAVERAQSESFHVILMDMQMPVMDGYTAATTLRRAGYELPIIALTANAMRGDEEKCRAAGCSGFLTKPVKIDVLLATLRELLADSTDQAPRDEPTARGRVSHAVENESTSVGGSENLSNVTEDDCQKAENTLSQLTELSCQISTLNECSPIRCSYPLDDPDFLEIAQEFLVRLKEKLAAMRAALAAKDHTELAGLAHWLKGSGGTAGFDVFTKPARELELAAKAEKMDESEAHIELLSAMADRIELPSNDAGVQLLHADLHSGNASPNSVRGGGQETIGEVSD